MISIRWSVIAVILAGLPVLPSLRASDLLPLEQRIGRYDESKFHVDKPTHLGTGELHYQALLSAGAVFNLGFMHRGIILPKSGIGHHFHNTNEEMFIVWGGEAVFTIDGRSSLLRGPVGAPLRAGHSHGVYNPGNVPLQWMNVNFRVGPPAAGRGGGGRGPAPFSFTADPTSVVNMGDDRANAPLDPVPVFQYTTFYRETLRPFPGYAPNKTDEAALSLGASRLRPVPSMNGGHGNVLYERCLGPSTYTGNWAFMDHYVLSPGATVGRHMHAGVEEIWYVMNGEGAVTVGSETAKLGSWDAVPIRAKEVHSFENTGLQDLEFMVVGVALEKGVLDSVDVK
jgi:mannose-6-phosphate isomerase-like protein (cupin superfamily)